MFCDHKRRVTKQNDNICYPIYSYYDNLCKDLLENYRLGFFKTDIANLLCLKLYQYLRYEIPNEKNKLIERKNKLELALITSFGDGEYEDIASEFFVKSLYPEAHAYSTSDIYEKGSLLYDETVYIRKKSGSYDDILGWNGNNESDAWDAAKKTILSNFEWMVRCVNMI